MTIWRRPGGRLEIAGYVTALAGPVILTTIVARAGADERYYVFLYMGLVAVAAVMSGLRAALLTAVVSFLLVDYFFVPPTGRLTIAQQRDVVNLVIFVGTAAVVGGLASNRRRAYLRAEQLARQLEQLNADLTRMNRQQAEVAEAALRLARSEREVTDRRELLANVSHDLRTPIATILTDSTNMLRTQQMNASVRNRLESIASDARRLNRLVSDMLDMASIEGGALHLMVEPVQLRDAIIAATDRLHRGSPDRPIQWTPDDDVISVLADWYRLGQILDNLLANADHAAPPGTPIVLAVTEDEGGMVTIRVIDSGPGVPAEIRDRLFTRFVTERDHVSDGTGLGLAITRGLVEAHGGSVVLEPSAQGATFRVRLPKADISSPMSASPKA